MAGGGGGGSSAQDAASTAAAVRERLEQQERRAEVDRLLAGQLLAYNGRDNDLVRERLDGILESLQDAAEVDRTVFGGSVSKHTYVDGLSDVDALVILDRAPDDNRTPADLRADFATELRANLRHGDIDSISAGTLAVTVTYKDGQQIQVLPALHTARGTFISSEDGQSWKRIDPGAFARDLTKVNQDAGGGVVPAIKVAKAVIAEMPEQHRVSSYHLEALAVNAFRGYDGAYSRSEMVRYLFQAAATGVQQRIGDVSGQSRVVDEYLGPRHSAERATVARAMQRMATRMRDGDTHEWRRMLGLP